ncbi:hypothetical protein GOP47_0025007 [Adiantum capillus-veneris]|uniref:Uncharacterized protein n=1 Tax=Adiantum capillus-veneris TaxID=13818 RepID=A0A9D4U3B3_ADICA|nr:hypothetical protein GOP47_0025007 [Adiantum capillus-veneris]
MTVAREVFVGSSMVCTRSMGISSSVRIVYSNLQILSAQATGLALARAAPSQALKFKQQACYSEKRWRERNMLSQRQHKPLSWQLHPRLLILMILHDRILRGKSRPIHMMSRFLRAGGRVQLITRIQVSYHVMP